MLSYTIFVFVFLSYFWGFLQLKGSQEPKAKKSRRSQMVEPKEEASVSQTVISPITIIDRNHTLPAARCAQCSVRAIVIAGSCEGITGGNDYH